MANIVIFDPGDSLKKVIEYRQSVNTPDFDWRSDVLVNPEVSALSGIPIKYWKVVNNQVLEMTQAEKDYRDGLEAQDIIDKAKSLAKTLQASDAAQERLMRAIVKLTVDQLNNLRTWTNQFKTVVANSNSLADIKSGVDGLQTFTTITYQDARNAIGTLIDGE